MPRKKSPNWEDIKTRRTVHGQSWAEIVEIYDVPLKTLRNRASREGWRDESGQIGTDNREIAKASYLADYEELRKLKLGAVLWVERKLLEEREAAIRGTGIQNGESLADPFAINAQKLGDAIALELLKHDNKLEIAKTVQMSQQPEDSKPLPQDSIRDIDKWPDDAKLTYLVTGEKPVEEDQ